MKTVNFFEKDEFVLIEKTGKVNEISVINRLETYSQ